MPVHPSLAELAVKVNNWGRWGAEDELGTLNLITPEAVLRGVASVRTGRAFSLAIPLSEDGPQIGAVPGRVNPTREMIQIHHALLGDPDQFCSSEEVVTLALQAATHWDALAHVSYAGRMYNGFALEVVDERGASHLGIDKVKSIVSRGVLLDVARLKGVDRLDGGYAITAEDLDGAAAQADVTVLPGDVVLVRTGHIQHLRAGDKVAYMVPVPGLSTMTVPWFHAHDVAAVAIDNFSFEVYPPEREDVMLPVHLLHLVEMGMTQGQNFDLEDLAADCAADGQYTFLLTANPEPFELGLGSPVNPVAIK